MLSPATDELVRGDHVEQLQNVSQQEIQNENVFGAVFSKTKERLSKVFDTFTDHAQEVVDSAEEKVENFVEQIQATQLLKSTADILGMLASETMNLKDKMALIQRSEIQEIMDLFQQVKGHENPTIAKLADTLGTRIDELYAALSLAQSERNMEMGRETQVETEKAEKKDTVWVMRELAEIDENIANSPYMELDIILA